MSDLLLDYGITTYVSQDILIVPFQSNFYDQVIEALRKEILHILCNKTDIIGLVVDISKITLLDLYDMQMFTETLSMANVLNVNAFLVGIQPSVALSLIELEYEIGELQTALNIEQATAMIHDASKNRLKRKTLTNKTDQSAKTILNNNEVAAREQADMNGNNLL